MNVFLSSDQEMGREPALETGMLCRQIRRFAIRRTASWGDPVSVFASVVLLVDVENMKRVHNFKIFQRH